jgi:hypothetical protein
MYPTWNCCACAEAHGGKARGGAPSSASHFGVCDVCEKEKFVTSPKDFGYPDYPLLDQ